MLNQIILPKTSWNILIDELIQVKIKPGYHLSDGDRIFLQQLNYIDEEGSLTEVGESICKLEYVTKDTEKANGIHYNAVLSLPVTQAILQSLWGVDRIGVDQVKNALVFLGNDEELICKRLTNLLQILNHHNIIIYNRKKRSIKLLTGPMSELINQAPDHIYIDSSRPFANDFYIREIIREAKGNLMWLDKYFQKEGFEWLWREADATKINSIQIVSLLDNIIDQNTLADYRRFKKELGKRGIVVEWRTLAKNKSHDFHDRWILDNNGLCYNLPSINSIKSGQRSEIHKSPNNAAIKAIFGDYFQTAVAV